MTDVGRVVVLGHRGMLGHVVERYLRQEGVDVTVVPVRFSHDNVPAFMSAVEDCRPRAIVNCLGSIKQKTAGAATLFEGNAVFPWSLRLQVLSETLVIHASTDCVFSGARGSYAVHETPDAEDSYGLSKRIGETISCRPNTQVIRASIIGPELGTSFGLFGWFASQERGTSVSGFCNHHWNGVTTLAWAQFALETLREHRVGLPGRIVHLSTSERHTKADVLRLLEREWQLGVGVESREDVLELDRTLLPTEVVPPLAELLAELHAWYR